MTGRPTIAALGLGLVISCVVHHSGPAIATVIPPPPDYCYQSRDIGQVELLTDFIPSHGEICFDQRADLPRMRSIAAEWAPRELPIAVVMKRDRTGYRLFMLSMLRDRRDRHSCWSVQRVARSDTGSPAAAWRWTVRAFDRWAASCPTLLTVGIAEAKQSLLARRADFERALARLAQPQSERFGPPEDGIDIGSFLPTRISQRLLDAVADACDGPRERLRLLADGTIAWNPDDRVPYGADGSRPFDGCVDLHIRSFPGYPRRN